MFTLNLDSTYLHLNNPLTPDTQIEALVDASMNGLYSVVASLNVVPVIKYMKSNAAEMVAKKLDTRLRDHVANLNQNVGDSQRPVLIIVDRVIDLQSMLKHAWTYVIQSCIEGNERLLC